MSTSKYRDSLYQVTHSFISGQNYNPKFKRNDASKGTTINRFKEIQAENLKDMSISELENMISDEQRHELNTGLEKAKVDYLSKIES